MNAPITDPREIRGLAIVAKGDPIHEAGPNEWRVPSQNDATKHYSVRQPTPGAWSCSCPDHTERRVVCKHIRAVLFVRTVTEGAIKAATKLVEPRPAKPRKPRRKVTVPAAPTAAALAVACKWCGCDRVKKNGFKSGKQEYRCLAESCGRAFIPNVGFARLKGDAKAICTALDLYFKGVSLRNLADTLESFCGVKVDHTTVYRWIKRYVALISDYAATLEPRVGDKWHADEVFTKFSGDLQYLWHVMDADTRYLLVSKVTAQRDDADAKAVMKEAARLADKTPDEIVTDGLPAYSAAVRARLRGATHTRETHLSKPSRYPNNNRVERLNGTVRQRQKVTRGLKKPDGPLTAGHQAYYNHVRPHQALDGKTPAEAAGVGITPSEGGTKWEALIRAALAKKSVEG